MDIKNDVKVSVLVPVYNVEKYVAECMESLVNQSLKEIEIICIDDGSTDGSGKILEKYQEKDSRIKLISKANTGYGNSMNVGLQMAKGDFIAIVESDDFAEVDMLESLYDAAVDSRADIVKSEYFSYREGKDSFAGRLRDYAKGKLLCVQDTPTILHLADTIWTGLYRRDFLKENNIVFHETKGASFQDISFAIQGWICASKVYFLEKPLLHYRRDNPDSSMHNPDKIFCVFDEYGWIEERFRDKWATMPEIEKYFVASKYRDFFNHYYRVASQYQYALLLRLKESFERDMSDGRINESTFLPETWQMLCSMHDNVNAFFQRTAKDTSDMRLACCKFENEYVYVNSFFNQLREFSRVAIYGAGKIGQRLAEVMTRRGCVIDCFAVTEIAENEKEYMGIPVKCLHELSDWNDSCAVIIAVVERNQYELYQNLAKYNFNHVFRVDAIIKSSLA